MRFRIILDLIQVANTVENRVVDLNVVTTLKNFPSNNPMVTHSENASEHPIEASDLGTDIRLTPQRRVVYEVLMEKRDHPTATEVFIRVKQRMPSISLATVYNCLETLTQAGLVRQVNLDRAPSRYCPNLNEHAHFHCESCGEISDVNLTPAESVIDLPQGFVVHKYDVALRGLCPKCSAKA